ncbi:GNAT family N-acetyltransferase [Rhizobium sp. 2YAF20]
MSPRWGRNLASASDIARHLNECGGDFAASLRARMDIVGYAQKILLNAECFEAWSGDSLVGLLAMYCNSPEQKSAFITNVSVLEEWRGRGIAGALIEQSMSCARQKQFQTICLEVEAGNLAAVAAYGKYGFVASDGGQSTLTMTRDLGVEDGREQA